MKAIKETVTFRMEPKVRKSLEIIAEEERRSFSSQLNVAIEEWLRIKNEIHPHFVEDIKGALKSGRPEPVWKG
ncbi:MAG: hypothetical protein A2Y00_02755 [Omnitrophica WOR_2 bacterium GWF2_43_52]|nr:MAG: hypothetical protein A2Y00_02755 [Omnitrophica WOR_2 bacterium GWF2_43_52]HAH20766.1 hypothetical protein [Candidatus Omnitrophota bacterium]HBG64439.1 hypothetical protein [Candidatus Omnitrophota bacterium]